MIKLYRLVPDALSTSIATGYVSSITEDLFYKLGFISIPNSQYFGLYSEGEGMVSEKNNGMFFFLSPWSCIKGLNFLRDEYVGGSARILEYEVPEEMVATCKRAFTNYQNYQAEGMMIPSDLLRNNGEFFTEVNDYIKSKLEKVSLQYCLDVIEDLNKNNSNKMVSFEEDNFYKKMQRINVRRFRKDELYFSSSFITGRSMLITRDDCDIMNSTLDSSSNETLLMPIINKANGILSFDNYNEYDQDLPNHKYGMMI